MEIETGQTALRGDDFALFQGSSVTRKQVEWLWQGRIPFGAVSILEGDPGLGKSTLLAAIVGAMTGGPALPNNPPLSPSPVLYVNLEDDLASTSVPRMAAHGANLDLVHVPEMGTASGARLFTLPLDLERIWAMFLLTKARLLILDPLMAVLGPEVNADNDQSVRQVFTDLAWTAREANAAIIVVRHLNKRSGVRAIYRGGGSIGIAAAARASLLLSKDPEHPEGRLLSQTKLSHAATPSTLAFRIETGADDMGRIAWDGERTISSDDLVMRTDGPIPVQRPRMRADQWLRAFLAEGAQPAETIVTAAESDGISLITLRRAAKDLGIQKSFTRQGADRGWWWALPAVNAEVITSEGVQNE